ncbi:MAG: DnaD domain protein [Christensenellales bacterium]
MYAKLSKEITSEAKIQVDNAFFTDFMPFAPENYVKVYLYGLSLAYLADETVNTIEEIAKRLNIDAAVVSEAFSYWANCGIVNVLSSSPASVEYLPINKNTLSLRKFSKTKYKDFNDQLHAMLPCRNILPNEYNEYYSIMEAMHIEPSAMLAVIAYSIRQKGEDVNYAYILAVARNLAHQGCLTYERVNEQLSEFDLYDKDLLAVLKSLGSKKSPTIDDKHLFKKWTKTMGFTLETVVQVAKSVKKGGMDRLDALMVKYYENRLFSWQEIEEFNKNRERLYSLTRNLNRIIGVYYEQLDFIIETYVTKWLNFGFDDETLLKIADYCFKHNIRTLEGLNETVEKFYRQGLLTEDSINAFMSEAVRRDEDIRAALDAAGVTRPITSRDRDAYRTWTYAWKMDKDAVLYAASLAAGNMNPVAYMNTVLGRWHSEGITSAEKAKAYKPAAVAATPVSKEVNKTYTSEQLNAMFDSLNYEDL